MDIPNPKRILAVSSPDSGLLDLVKGLTNSSPTITGDSVAGTTHLFNIKTSYYTATIPIWLDEILEPITWAQEFLAPEAREVLTVLGAFIVCFRKPVNEDEMVKVKELLESVGEVIKEGCGYGWDGVCLAVGMPQSQTPFLEISGEAWEDVCQDYGFEWVDSEAKGRNEFSEPMGLERLKEALESNDWAGGEEYGGEIDFDNLEDDDEADETGSLDFGIGSEEMKDEMAGMKKAIYGGNAEDEDEDEQMQDVDEEEVEKLQAMMLKMQAVRDMGSDMPESERKKFAVKVVNDIMKTL